MKVHVLICARNEEHTAPKVISQTLKYADKVLFITDGNTDRTVEVVKSAFLKNRKVEVISWPDKKGKGFALIHGFKQFLDSDGDILVTLDADGQHTPEDIPVVTSLIKSGYVDMVLGSRMNREIKYPRRRVFFNILTSLVVLSVCGGFYPDVASGYRTYNRKAIKAILPYLRAHDFSIELEILRALALQKHVATASVPIHCETPKKTTFWKLARAYTGFAWRYKTDVIKRILGMKIGGN